MVDRAVDFQKKALTIPVIETGQFESGPIARY